MTERELEMAVAQIMEPMPAPATADELRATYNPWVWYSHHMHLSPRRWWGAQIGSDNSGDKELVTWEPVRDATVDMSDTWEVVEKMREMGWTTLVRCCFDGYVVEMWPHYNPSPLNMIQVPGDEVAPTICQAAVAACSAGTGLTQKGNEDK